MEKINFVNYIGGKYYLLKYIYKYLDKTKECFIDLFGGSGSVILNLEFNYKVKIYNDIDDNLFNLFMQIKNNFETFSKEIELPYSESLFKYFFQKYKNNNYKDNLEKAVVYYYLGNVSFSGAMHSFSYSFVNNQALTYENKCKNIHVIYDRIKELTILNKDYKDILDSIKDKKNIMLYVDPPYYKTEYYYNGDFNHNEHIRLSEYLNKLECSIMLSYYYFDIVEELYPRDKWYYIEIPQVKHSYGITKNSKSKQKPKSIELLITNYSSEHYESFF